MEKVNDTGGWGQVTFGAGPFGGLFKAPHGRPAERRESRLELDRIKGSLNKNTYFDNIFIMPKIRRFDMAHLRKMKTLLNKREEEIYVVMNRRIFWLNDSARDVYANVLGLSCKVVCSTRAADCRHLKCHGLTKPFVVPNYGRLKMLYPFYDEQDVCGVVVIKFKKRLKNANHFRPVLITSPNEARPDPQGAGEPRIS